VIACQFANSPNLVPCQYLFLYGMCICTNIVGMHVAQLLGLWLIHNRMGYIRNQQKLLLFHQLSIHRFLEVYVEQSCTISTCYHFHVTGCRCCGHSNLLGYVYGCYFQWTNNYIIPIHINTILFCSIVYHIRWKFVTKVYSLKKQQAC